MKNYTIISFVLVVSMFQACAQQPNESKATYGQVTLLQPESDKVTLTEAEWQQLLSPEAFNVLRQSGTERAFTGEFWDFKGDGVYCCAACGNPLFDSKTKFKSGTGWPSYYKPINGTNVGEIVDNDYGMQRTEVVCNRCQSHLGHVFEDGPAPTGLRYCINSVSLQFSPRTK